ncbi:MAG: Sigma-54 dependent transcriptional regulator [Bryobacterales bacterium]|nr:Sigma-54 dependent transcriptional regulator [Bryobacterales bacterium]
MLHEPTAELKAPGAAGIEGRVTLDAAEREHILRALKETSWVVGAPSGAAAARLGLKRTTVQRGC